MRRSMSGGERSQCRDKPREEELCCGVWGGKARRGTAELIMSTNALLQKVVRVVFLWPHDHSFSHPLHSLSPLLLMVILATCTTNLESL